ncbi:YncE family protein [Terracidiphilus sp.]|uniref:YncE family protein n=1 Tax=Terracidiphilus sp. TaxID=1964191 RepID=UPI003C1C44F3
MVFSFSVFRLVLAGVALTAVFAAPALVSAEGPYKVLNTWKLGGEGGWDYLSVDPATHRLYITRGARVDAVDTATGKVVGSIAGLHGTHGVAFDDAGKYGYISDAGAANQVVVFDRTTLATVTTIPAGTGPDAILFEPVTKTVWAFNGRSKDATVIDTATQKVVATVALGGKPEFPAADGKGFIYDNIEDKSEIVKIDAKTKTVTATWPAGCEGPSGLAIDREGGKLFAVCDKTMSVIDVKTGKVLATPAIGDGPDAAGFSAKHKLAFASCGEGVLNVVDAASLKTVQTLTTEKRARTMAYDPASDRVYTVTADFGTAPAATAENPRPRPPVLPDSFRVIVIGR